MKKGLLVVVTMLCLAVAGCEPKDVTPEQMVKIGGNIETLSDQIKIYQQLVTSYAALLAESGAIDANDLAAVDKLIAEADRVTPELNKIALAIQAGNYSDSEGIITLLEGMRAANSATKGFNKYWAAIDAILLISISILGWLFKNKASEANLSTTTLGAVTKALEASTQQAKDEVKPKVAANLSAAKITNEGKALITKVKAA